MPPSTVLSIRSGVCSKKCGGRWCKMEVKPQASVLMRGGGRRGERRELRLVLSQLETGLVPAKRPQALLPAQTNLLLEPVHPRGELHTPEFRELVTVHLAPLFCENRPHLLGTFAGEFLAIDALLFRCAELQFRGILDARGNVEEGLRRSLRNSTVRRRCCHHHRI